MALDIQAPNFNGLANLAGARSGNLGLSVPGGLGLQALQQVQHNENTKRDQQLALAGMQQQGLLGLQQQQIQRQGMNLQAAQADKQGLFAQNELDFRKQNAAQQGEQFQSEMAFKDRAAQQQAGQFQTQADIKKQETAVDQAKIEMTKLLAEDKQAIKEKGAFAAYALMSMKEAKTPEESKQLREEILKEALSKGFISKEEADKSAKMPISQFNMGLGYKLMQYGTVDEYKKMNPDKKESTSGVSEMVDAQGNVFRTSSLATPVKSQVQKDIIGAQDNLKELKSMLDNVPDSFFGASALKQSSTWYREWAEKVPMVGELVKPSEKDKSDLAKYNAIQSQVKNQSMNIIRNLSGLSYTDKQLAFMNEIVPSVGPNAVKSEFKGKSKNLIRFFEQIQNDRQELLDKGMQVGSTEYKDELLKRMRTTVDTLKKDIEVSPDLIQQYKSDPRYKDWSEEKIKRALEGANKNAK